VGALHDEAYGVAIMDELEKRLKRKIHITAVHVAFKRLEEKGIVKSRFGGVTSDRGGRRKKFYVMTTYGKKVLDAQYDLRTGLYSLLPRTSFSR